MTSHPTKQLRMYESIHALVARVALKEAMELIGGDSEGLKKIDASLANPGTR